ncbi:hypothetical protein HDU87_003194 [Geranomyces variabilis]|uniref:Uncharacterized protein n=1 Tax=Geranomyces variabilis TaxID=109894 RepID=A0AAD5TK33_9FUNG|nr:hypothetical protein HDU87_003194 [Geranomyces variabilis]
MWKKREALAESDSKLRRGSRNESSSSSSPSPSESEFDLLRQENQHLASKIDELCATVDRLAATVQMQRENLEHVRFELGDLRRGGVGGGAGTGTDSPRASPLTQAHHQQPQHQQQQLPPLPTPSVSPVPSSSSSSTHVASDLHVRTSSLSLKHVPKPDSPIRAGADRPPPFPFAAGATTTPATTDHSHHQIQNLTPPPSDYNSKSNPALARVALPAEYTPVAPPPDYTRQPPPRTHAFNSHHHQRQQQLYHHQYQHPDMQPQQQHHHHHHHQQRIIWVVPNKWASSATSLQSLASHFADLRTQAVASFCAQPWWVAGNKNASTTTAGARMTTTFVKTAVMAGVDDPLEWVRRRDAGNGGGGGVGGSMSTVVVYASYAATGDRIPDMDSALLNRLRDSQIKFTSVFLLLSEQAPSTVRMNHASGASLVHFSRMKGLIDDEFNRRALAELADDVGMLFRQHI